MSAPYTRITNDARVTNLNSELTYTEGDDNLLYLLDQLDLLKDISGLTPYSPSSTYLGGVTYIVGYSGIAYLFISTSNQTGVTPLGNPLVWQPVSNAILLHQQNTDNYLAFGTANEVTASVAHELIYNQIISVSTTALITLVSSSTLKPNRTYFINDIDGGFPVFVKSISNSSISNEAKLMLRSPLQTIEEWISDDDGASYIIDDVVVYGTWVYTNLTGSNTNNPPDVDNINWQVLGREITAYEDRWVSVSFGVQTNTNSLKFEEVHDPQINFKMDSYYFFNNVFLYKNNKYDNYTEKNSAIIATNYTGIFASNSAINGGTIIVVKGIGSISFVKVNHATFTHAERIDGSITEVFLERVKLIFPNGLNAGETFQKVSICGFSMLSPSAVELRVRANQSVNEDTIITPQGSTLIDISNPITTVTNLDLSIMGYPDLFGGFVIVSDSTQIVKVLNYHGFFPVELIPDGSTSFDIYFTDPASASAHNQLIINPNYLTGAATILGNANQKVILKKRVQANGFNCILCELIG